MRIVLSTRDKRSTVSALLSLHSTRGVKSVGVICILQQLLLRALNTSLFFRIDKHPLKITSRLLGLAPSSLPPNFDIERRTTYIDLQVHQMIGRLQD